MKPGTVGAEQHKQPSVQDQPNRSQSVNSAVAPDDFRRIGELIEELARTTNAATIAASRITRSLAGHNSPERQDVDVLDSWLATAMTLASLTCSWDHPQMKACGARLDHLASELKAAYQHC